tara:strand:- start:43 stop:405 length:363 start_codon:yes stop_codon:yes gene_type:complete
MKNEYNGWHNYETWNFKLWLDNDEMTHNCINDYASQLLTKAGRIPAVDRDADIYDLSQYLSELAENWAKDANLQPSFISDMVNSSIKEVNFYEIAEQWYIEVEAEELRKIRAELEELKTV